MNANNILREWPHRWYGFWKSGGTIPDDELPSIADAIDLLWNPDDKASLIAYLRQSPGVLVTTYPVPCLLCTAQLPRTSQSDDVWIWHGNLVHYVTEHQVVLPDAFVEHIRARDYTPPTKLELEHWELPWPDSWPGAKVKPNYGASIPILKPPG